MNVLIVHAHPEPKSFNAAMTARALGTFAHRGDRATVSDLYRMRFDPVSDRRNFRGVANGAFLKMQEEELHAARGAGFADDLSAEMNKLLACDLLIFQFPMWWLGLPAILKGWVDRVLACGLAYGGGRYFESGALRGKQAMCALTVGGSEEVYSSQGLYAAIEAILYPLHHGTFAFTGMTVLRPFVVYGPGRMSDEERAAELDRYARHLGDLDILESSPIARHIDFPHN